jgi:hypothetical protein
MTAPCQKQTGCLLFSLHQMFGDFAGLLDEKLRDGADRTVLQGDDSVSYAGLWQFNGQDLEFRVLGGKSQCGNREKCDKAPGRRQIYTHLRGIGDHNRAGIIEPTGAKCFHYDRSDHASRRRQHPRLVRQIGKLDPAPPNPLTLRAHRDDKCFIKEEFEIQSLVDNGGETPFNQEIDLTIDQFAMQYVPIAAS